jgi:hypothetical protein
MIVEHGTDVEIDTRWERGSSVIGQTVMALIVGR